MYFSSEQSHTPTASSRARVIISRTLSVAVGTCVIAYMVLMVQTISLINERKDIRTEIRDTQVAISDLEVRYFELAQSIDQKVISDLGFTESVIPVFAYTNTKPSYPTVALIR